MDLGLREKVAIVTGASRGIGQGIARSLAAEGCRLVLCARGAEDLEATANMLRAQGAEVVTLTLDVTHPEAGERLVQAAREQFGRVDILVGNAGGNRRGYFEETSEADWSALIELNLRAHLRCARAAIPVMRALGGGAIVFIASIFGREAGGPGLSIYNSTKSALISAAKILALELAPYNIRVNTVAPGSIRFPGGSWDRRLQEDPEGTRQFIAQNIPMGRFGTVEEVADVVTFLVSERARWVTGACINVDGGQSRSLI
ncbi:SDR family NAD(P)-dependent oxidoreductase [Rhodothermus profundi]|uniref:3-oxoacyl-[acyl-carrier protein] reductase n=1 Tax=Rhodothermus profundi TaxID=633813 RepID=A0A1M6PSH9_9BACT|nr:SDR family NAD(P)-dependent oxidoreductase [Rhodothermus profundi]SHK10851.1 3-oxoacyl-[acyl-carrier protein] reductase [Rhodothermus profundi]